MLSPYYRTRLLVLAAVAICFALFWWAGKQFGIPMHPGYQVSLIMQPSAAAGFIVAAVLLMVSVAIGLVIAGGVRPDVAMVVACLGMAAWSFRGGSSERTWFWGLATGAGPQGVFLGLFFEMVILAAIVAAGWYALRMMRVRGILEDDGEKVERIGTNLMALGVQVAAGAIAVYFVAQSTDKQQVLAAAFLCGFAGPMASQWFAPTSSRGWHFAAPLIVGMIGYLFAYVNPAGVATGDLSGALAALARPLPLDYASAGPAGAIMGHWMAQQWANEEEQPALQARPVSQA